MTMGLKERIVTIVSDLVFSEERFVNACLAISILGDCASFMWSKDFSSKTAKFAFNVMIQRFKKLFTVYIPSLLADNENTEADTSYLPPETLYPQIYAIHAIAKFFKSPPAQSEYFLNFIDKVFVDLLRNPIISPLIHAAIVHVLHTHLPKTNRNRLRIDRLYRVHIAKFSGFPERLDDPPMNSSVPLRKELELFWSVWNIVPSDKSILQIATNSDNLANMPSGYVSRRLNWFMSQFLHSGNRQKKIKLTEEMMNSTIQKWNRVPYKQQPWNIARGSTIFAPDFHSAKKDEGASFLLLDYLRCMQILTDTFLLSLKQHRLNQTRP